jgi:hypothetical protein
MSQATRGIPISFLVRTQWWNAKTNVGFTQRQWGKQIGRRQSL